MMDKNWIYSNGQINYLLRAPTSDCLHIDFTVKMGYNTNGYDKSSILCRFDYT